MLVMVGHSQSENMIKVIKRNGFSRMMLDRRPDPFEGEKWGFDNGAFGWWLKGKPFDEFTFALRLQRAIETGYVPHIAVVPDLVAGGMASLDFSLGWLARLPHKWPWYLALQDGMSQSSVAQVIEMFDGLFLGGTDKFKGTAQQWCDLAHSRGKRFHYGRAGSLQ